MHYSYWVSTEGRIYSEIVNRILLQSTDRDGYKNIGLHTTTRKQINLRVNRLVLITFSFVPNFRELESNHINGIKSDNRLVNLEWTTGSENVKHAFRTGLHSIPYGEKNPMASISDEKANYIGYLLSTKMYSNLEIANIVGCKSSVVSSIRTGRCWHRVYDKYDLRSISCMFTFNQLNYICWYFEFFNIKELTLDIKHDILYRINMPIDNNTEKIIEKIFDKKDYTDISFYYNF